MATDLLLKVGQERFLRKESSVEPLTRNKAANDFVTDLARFPHRYVLGCLMDRQILYEKAWEIPYKVFQLTGASTIDELASISRDEYVRLFVENNLHRFNKIMGDIFYCGVQDIKRKYAGDASKIWTGKPDSETVVGRFLEFKGAGPKIATMAANLLVRCFNVELSDYRSIDISADTHVQCVMKRFGCVPKDADIDAIIDKARELSPDFPGLIDFACFEIGLNYCFAKKKPDCAQCPLNSGCKKVL